MLIYILIYSKNVFLSNNTWPVKLGFKSLTRLNYKKEATHDSTAYLTVTVNSCVHLSYTMHSYKTNLRLLPLLVFLTSVING